MKTARARVAVVAILTTVVMLACLSLTSRPAGADTLCLDGAGNFVPCANVTAPSGTTGPSTTTTLPPASGQPVAGNQSAASPNVQVGLPDLDHVTSHAAGSQGPGLAGPLAVFDAALIALLAFAVIERRRAPR